MRRHGVSRGGGEANVLQLIGATAGQLGEHATDLAPCTSERGAVRCKNDLSWELFPDEQIKFISINLKASQKKKDIDKSEMKKETRKPTAWHRGCETVQKNDGTNCIWEGKRLARCGNADGGMCSNCHIFSPCRFFLMPWLIRPLFVVGKDTKECAGLGESGSTAVVREAQGQGSRCNRHGPHVLLRANGGQPASAHPA